MEALMHVDGIAYCKIKVGDKPMPPSYNLINHITMQEGIGIAVPTLQVNFMDVTGSLQHDLNLVQGTECEITIARTEEDSPKPRKFSLWGLERYTDSEGPAVKALFILDIPKWSAGVYCENFKDKSSSDAIRSMASSAGLTYKGPSGSMDDSMNWLNINQTRSSFSEDVAMRGYGSKNTCMLRAVTLDKELRYKDLFTEIKSPKKKLHLNKENGDIVMRETTDGSVSGVFAHWLNYGWKQYEHSLNDDGQQETKSYDAPSMSGILPISSRVRGEVSDSEGSRVTYTGWDTGTKDKEQSNVHKKYETAFYQNMRGLGLWGEKLRSLTPFVTNLQTFDCVTYAQKDPDGQSFSESKSRNGDYLVSGKTIRIKNGHNYSEVIDLIRPYVASDASAESGGGGSSSGAGSPSFGANKGVASAGDSASVASVSDRLNNALYNTKIPKLEEPISLSPVPQVVSMTKLFSHLNDFADGNPSIPTKPVGGEGSMTKSSPMVKAQQEILNSLQQVLSTESVSNNRVQGDMDTNIANYVYPDLGGGDVSISDKVSVHKIDSSMVETSAIQVIEAKLKGEEVTDNLGSVVEKPLITRLITLEELKSTPTQSITNSNLIDSIQEDSNLYDVQDGGNFNEIDEISHSNNLGSLFVVEPKNIGIKDEDVILKPNSTATKVLDFVADHNKPENLLQSLGKDQYTKMFGDVNHIEASEQLAKMEEEAQKTKSKFSADELLAGAGLSSILKTTDVIDNALEGDNDLYKKVSDSLYDSTSVLTKPVTNLINTASGVKESVIELEDKISNPFSAFSDELEIPDEIPAGLSLLGLDKVEDKANLLAQPFKFVYGQAGSQPVVDIVKSTQLVSDETLAVFTTYKEIVTWSNHAKMGVSYSASSNSTKIWSLPREFPFEDIQADSSASNYGIT